MGECTRCLLPEGRFGVELGADGTCNYCSHWEANRARLTDYATLRPHLDERVKKLPGGGTHDALLGFSGGKDSCYVAHRLVHEHGLKPLLLTIDNGFLNQYAKDNIRRAADALELDHEFFRFPEEVQRAFFRAAFQVYGDVCVGCAVPVYYQTFRAAYDRGIKLVFHGRSPFQILRNYYPGTKDVFLELHESNYRPHSFDELRRIYGLLDDHARGWLAELFPDEDERARMYDAVFLDPAKAELERLPDFVGLFQFENYDEEAIKSEMAREVGYERPKGDGLLGHGDCDLHEAAGYILRDLHGATSTLTEIAVMVRLGAMTLDEARALRARHEAAEGVWPEASFALMGDKLRMGVNEIRAELERHKTQGAKKFGLH